MTDEPAPWVELRDTRIEAGLTITELAAAAGLSVPFVWQLEAGHRGARVTTLRELAAALNPHLAESQQLTPLDLDRSQPHRPRHHRSNTEPAGSA